MQKCRHLILALAAFFFAAAAVATAQSGGRSRDRDHWAWKAPQRPAIPEVRNKAWVQNPIDAFILAKLEAAGLAPAKSATREQLIRRASFDLIGLPPTPAEIDAFINDTSPDAWEKVIDRLLSSPHYGERWGRHWLDLARYAESNGYEHDEVRPNAWRYRDYIIQSFNADKPYDRFIREQLAGDELYPDDPRALVATGFNLLGPDMTDAASQKQRRQNTLDDMTDTASLVFLGLTMGCARCHNHRFEPISQADYYRLQAFFTASAFRNDLPFAEPREKAAHAKRMKAYKELIRPTQEALAELEAPYRKKLVEARMSKLAEAARIAHQTPPAQRTRAQKELVESTNRFLAISEKELMEAMSKEDQSKHVELQKQLRQLEKRKPAPLPTAMGLAHTGREAIAFVLQRGELSNPGDKVQPGLPRILRGDVRTDVETNRLDVGPQPGPRAQLANWLTDPDNPLTARVLVNRLWQHHFGRGIVATTSDFGTRGEPPSHPELLDWLARELVSQGWSLKRMHKLMLLSATYQQSTIASEETMKADPNNLLFSRMNRLRLEGEIIRDSLLSISRRLNPRMGGPGVFPPLPAETIEGAKEWKTSPDPADHVRRSVYIFARRNLRFPFLEPFDVPDSNQSCPKREQSTTAPQALALLNASEIAEAATALAARLQQEADSTDGRITLAYRLALGRRPTEAEMQLAREFLQESPLHEFCRVLFNLNEFVYLD